MNLPFSTMKQQFVVIKRRASLAETITCEKVLRRANRGNSHPLTRIRNQSVSEEIPWCSDLPARVGHVRREERREERTQQNRAIVSHQGETGCKLETRWYATEVSFAYTWHIGTLPGDAALIVGIYWPVPGDVLHFKPRRSTLSDFAGFQCNNSAEERMRASS